MNALGGITRRMVLKAIALGAAMSAARAGQSPDVAQSTVSGRVTTDAGNGSRGIPGVLVTNGLDVVQTNVDGYYSLPLPDEGIISVVKPTGFSVEISLETRLPRFHYIHQPKGTPVDLVLSGPRIAPTGENVGSIDFVLSPRHEASAFNVMLLADPQPGDDEEVDFIRDDVIPRLLDVDAAFGITLGDIVGDNLPLIPRICRLIGQAKCPWYNVCGNHDLNYESPDNRYARETFKSYFGPSHYALEYAGAT